MELKTQVYKRIEIVFESKKSYDNPFMDVDIDAVFTHEDGTEVSLPGFWNGNDQWKVRFSAEKAGKWNYTVTCTDKENPSLTGSGVIEASPCLEPKNELEKHGYVRLEKGKKHMVYNDGTPFFYLGDTHWMMPDYERLHECNYPGCNCGSQFKHIVRDRLKKGFNVYQTYFSSSSAVPSASGKAGWWKDSDHTLINPEPFNEVMDVMMDHLADNGITIALGFGTHCSTVKAYKQNVTAMKAFARYAVARYACYPLIWITAQEITNYQENAFDCWKQVGAYVGELDGYHRPNGAHMHCHTFEQSRSQELDKEPWHQWWTVQAGHGGYHNLRGRSYYKGYYYDDKMFIETESQYEDIYCSGFCGHDAPRMGAWQALQLGSGGFTYGVTGIWVAGWHQKYAPALLNYSPESWFTGLDKPGSEQVGYMKKFYEYVKWYELEPCYDFKFGNFDDRRHIVISHKGNDVVVYYFFGTDVDTGIFTTLKPSTAYKARLFDPICGKFIDLPDLVTSEEGTANIPSFPAMRDWVLLLNVKEIDFGPYETYEYPIVPIIATADAKLDKELEIKGLKASSEDEDFPAKNMLDGDPETYWKGFAPKTSQTITIDLGETKHFDYFNIVSPDTQRFIQFRIWGSNDGENYDLLAERTAMQVAIGGRFGNYFDPVSGDYRYVKFFLNSDANISEPLKVSKVALYTKKED
jgi:hypothetical protein